jgi:hypothetical protein
VILQNYDRVLYSLWEVDLRMFSIAWIKYVVVYNFLEANLSLS